MDLDLITKGKILSSNELNILTYLVSNIDNLDNLSLKEISKQAFTSPATIVRLAQKLDFSGSQELFYYLKSRPTTHNKIVNDVLDFQMNTEELEPLIQEMKNIYFQSNKFIMIYANGFSSILADYLQKKLLVNGIKTLAVNATDSSGVLENNVDDICMFISISKSGETQKVFEKMKYCHLKHVPNILFTGNPTSRCGLLSDITFEVSDESPLDRQNIHYTSFFGKLILLFEFIVQEFVK
ncbi:SIS domain-containing protein [Enterococcus cecorum]|uniref:MurR/RpiR family transcriptional regulator n=1 Tax=Enterococcus cecorum TaxID=44008 RepID=UPI0032C4B1B3